MLKHSVILLIINIVAFAEGAETLFDISTIHTGQVKSQTVLTAFQDNSTSASLILVTVDADDQRKLAVFEHQDGGYGMSAEVVHSLSSDVIFMDTGRVGNHQVLVQFTRGSAWQYDPRSNRRHKLISFSSVYRSPVYGSVPKMDLLRDLNGDGLDDFIIPSFDGFQVFVQNDQGGFDSPASLSAPPLLDMSYTNIPSYQPRKSFLADMTLDGREDLIFWLGGRFAVFGQMENGRFAVDPVLVRPNVQFEYESMESMSNAMQGQDQSDSIAKALFQIADMDGDGIPDLLTLSLKSEGVFRKATTYEMHKGVAGGDLVEFMPTPVSSIRSDGIQFDVKEKDFDGDGQIDLVISAVELGIGRVLRALITGSMTIDLGFYQMRDGRYPKKPNFKHQVTAEFSWSSGNVYFPSVLISDFDGDNIDDLLVQVGSEKMKLYIGGRDGKLFSRKGINIDVPMSNDPDLVELVDLNSDGKKDIIMRLQAVGQPRSVVVMVSR